MNSDKNSGNWDKMELKQKNKYYMTQEFVSFGFHLQNILL